MQQNNTIEAPLTTEPQTSNESKHLIERYLEQRAAGKAPQSLVIGHRGGYLDGPENSMRCFRAAVGANLEGIEFDVWLSKDNVMMIMHGGNDGQLSHYGHPDDHVFDWTAEELMQLDIGEGERMPTLEQLFQLSLEAPNMLLNIEVKAPDTPEIAARYDTEKAANTLCHLISKYRVAKRTMISSFNVKQLQEIKRASQGQRDFLIQSLRNYDGGPDPADYALNPDERGVNLIYSLLNRQLVQRLRESEQHMLLGVWYWTKYSQEDAQMYMRVFKTCSPIDFFYSDRPLTAMEARNAIQTSEGASESQQ